jgi:type I restriction enzyme R subunit
MFRRAEFAEGDAVSYVDSVLKTKLLESETLRAQASANTKEQFSNSPSLQDELLKAIMDAMAAHQTMRTQALASEIVQARILSVLLGPGELWSALRGATESGLNQAA